MITAAELELVISGNAASGVRALSDTDAALRSTQATAESSVSAIEAAITGLGERAGATFTELKTQSQELASGLQQMQAPLQETASAGASADEAMAALRTQLQELAAAAQQAAEEQLAAAQGARELSAAAQLAAEEQLQAAEAAHQLGASAQAAAAEQDAAAEASQQLAGNMQLLRADTEVASAQLSLLGTDAELAGAKLSAMGTEAETAGTKASAASEGSAAFSMAIQLAAQYAIQAGADVLEMGMQFEASEAKLVALAGVSQQQAAQMGQAALDIASKTGQSAQQMGQGLYFLASAGFQGRDALTVMDVAAKAATGSQTDFKTVVDALTSSLRAYGAGADQADNYANLLIRTVTAGKMEMDDFARNIGKVAEVASASGIGLDQVGASMAVMTQKGVSAARAAQGLQSEIQAFIKPTAGARQELADLGLTVEQVQLGMKNNLVATLQDLYERAGGNIDVLERLIPNVRALNQFLGTAGDTTGAYNAALATMHDENITVSNSFQTMSQTAQGSLAILKSHIQTDLIETTAGIERAIAPAAQSADDFLTMLDKAGSDLSHVGWLGQAEQIAKVATAFVLFTNPLTMADALFLRFKDDLGSIGGRLEDAAGEVQKVTDKLIPLEDKLKSLEGPLDEVKDKAGDVFSFVGDVAGKAADVVTGSGHQMSQAAKDFQAGLSGPADDAVASYAAITAAATSTASTMAAPPPTTAIDVIDTALQNAGKDADEAKTKLQNFLKVPTAGQDQNAIAIAATTQELRAEQVAQAGLQEQITQLPSVLVPVITAQKQIDDLWNAGKTNAPEYAAALKARADAVAAAQRTEGQATVDNALTLQQQSDAVAQATKVTQSHLSTLQTQGQVLTDATKDLQLYTDAADRGSISVDEAKTKILAEAGATKEQQQAALDAVDAIGKKKAITDSSNDALAQAAAITSAATSATDTNTEAVKVAGQTAVDSGGKISQLGPDAETAASGVQDAVNTKINPALKSVGDVTPNLGPWANSLISQAVSAASTAAAQANAILAGVAGQAAAVAQSVAHAAAGAAALPAPIGTATYNAVGESDNPFGESGDLSYAGVDSRQPPRAPSRSARAPKKQPNPYAADIFALSGDTAADRQALQAGNELAQLLGLTGPGNERSLAPDAIAAEGQLAQSLRQPAIDAVNAWKDAIAAMQADAAAGNQNQYALDKAKADSAKQAAQDAFDAWHTEQQNVISDQKAAAQQAIQLAADIRNANKASAAESGQLADVVNPLGNKELPTDAITQGQLTAAQQGLDRARQDALAAFNDLHTANQQVQDDVAALQDAMASGDQTAIAAAQQQLALDKQLQQGAQDAYSTAAAAEKQYAQSVQTDTKALETQTKEYTDKKYDSIRSTLAQLTGEEQHYADRVKQIQDELINGNLEPWQRALLEYELSSDQKIIDADEQKKAALIANADEVASHQKEKSKEATDAVKGDLLDTAQFATRLAAANGSGGGAQPPGLNQGFALATPAQGVVGGAFAGGFFVPSARGDAGTGVGAATAQPAAPGAAAGGTPITINLTIDPFAGSSTTVFV